MSEEPVVLVDHYLVKDHTSGKLKRSNTWTESMWVLAEANRLWPDDDIRQYKAYCHPDDQETIRYKLIGGNHIKLEEIE